MRRSGSAGAIAATLARASTGAVLVACAATALATPSIRLGPGPVSSVIYPAQEILVAFDHAMHVGELALSCTDCHTLAPTSRSPRDSLLPREEACVDCHGDATRADGRGAATAEDRCRYCHPRAGASVVPSRVPPAHLRFSHEAHAGVGQCTRCHTRVEVRGLATMDDLPGMRLCLGCHDGRQADRRCPTCHLSDGDGVLRTELGGARLLPPDWMERMEHGVDWTNAHGQVAVERSATCNSCHREHECLACHDGSVRPRDVHPGDWMASHAIEARAREQRCESCHRGQSFCRTCHLRAGVAQGSPPAVVGPTAARVHEDPAWASGLEQTHGREARRAIQTCVSCHAGRDCVTCHAFVNPHPPGFESRCRSLVAARARACTACHDSLDGLCD